MPNQNPEQIARDKIDKQLIAFGWVIQKRNQINLNAGLGIAVTEYQTDIGPEETFRNNRPAYHTSFTHGNILCQWRKSKCIILGW